MKTYAECIPCFQRQAREAATLAGADSETMSSIVKEVDKYLPTVSLEMSPPGIARKVYGIVNEYTGGKDVYRHIKEKSNSMAMELYPELKKYVEDADDILLSSVRLAVAGNVIDYGVPHSFDIEREIEECLEKDFAVFDYPKFHDAVAAAKNILYVLDNAGEIVFDRILVEELARLGKEVVCAVRGSAIINDVTMEDAEAVGLTGITKVISSGSDIPGTVVGETTAEFRSYYDEADIIVSKGQGNFETMADENAPIFFIFKAKCPQVARHIGCEVGDIILKSVKR